MLGLNAYTISSGIFPKYLNGENIISVPLAENETMHIGYVQFLYMGLVLCFQM